MGTLKGRNNIDFKAGDRVAISGPNCDDDIGYIYDAYDVLWRDEMFILYGNVGFWPNLNKIEHVAIKALENG